MRPLVFLLATLAACQTTPAALTPEADPSLLGRSPHDQIADLAEQVALLSEQLRSAQATIAALEGEVFETDAETGARTSKIEALTIKQKITENAVGEMLAAEGPIFAGMGVLQNQLNDLRVEVFEEDEATGARTSKIEALTIKQKVTENAVGEMRREAVVTQGYLAALAGAELAEGADAEALGEALFGEDPGTGASAARVDGLVRGIVRRVQHRDTLTAEWEGSVGEIVQRIAQDPGSILGAQRKRRLPA